MNSSKLLVLSGIAFAVSTMRVEDVCAFPVGESDVLKTKASVKQSNKKDDSKSDSSTSSEKLTAKSDDSLAFPQPSNDMLKKQSAVNKEEAVTKQAVVLQTDFSKKHPAKGDDSFAFPQPSNDVFKKQPAVNKEEAVTKQTVFPQADSMKNKSNDRVSNTEKLAKRLSRLSEIVQNVSDELASLEIGNDVRETTSVVAECSAPWTSHFYIGVGAEFGWLAAKDKVTSDKRTLIYDQHKVDYYSMVSSILSSAKFDDNGNIVYGSDGYPSFEERQDPKDDPEIKALYSNGNLISGNEAKVKELLAKKAQEFLGKDGLNIISPNANRQADGYDHFRYTRIKINLDKYWDGTAGATGEASFYFGNRSSPQDPIEYSVNGINSLNNLVWRNLILTDDNPAAAGAPATLNQGPHLTILQVVGDVLEQAYEEMTPYRTNSGLIGTYNTMFSERYKENGTDKFTKRVVLPPIDDETRSNRQIFGGTVFCGYSGKSGSVVYGAEVEAGYSNTKVQVQKADKKESLFIKDRFGDGTIQYVDKTEVISNPVNGKVLGPVYDPSTGKVRPVYVSGFGRMATAKICSLPDPKNAYELEVKRGLNFAINPIIGFSRMNTTYYASFGITLTNYTVTIKPSESIDAYYNKLPTSLVYGYFEGSGGSTYLHKYVARKNADGEIVTIDELMTQKKSMEKMEPIYPSATLETNSAGEKNTFAGLRALYPHYDDGGVRVDETSSPRPWDTGKAIPTTKFKQFRVGFEPGIGVRTYLSKRYFVDFRYSFQLGSKINVSHDDYALYPAHIGRPKMHHKISVSGHKVRISFGMKM